MLQADLCNVEYDCVYSSILVVIMYHEPLLHLAKSKGLRDDSAPSQLDT